MRQWFAPHRVSGSLEEIGRRAVSPSDAARIAGVGRTTIYAEMKAGRLRSSKIGSRRLITIDAIDEWLEAMEAPVDGYDDAGR